MALPQGITLEFVPHVLVLPVEFLGHSGSFTRSSLSGPDGPLGVLSLVSPFGVLVGDVGFSSLLVRELLQILSNTPLHTLDAVVFEVITII